MGGGQGGSVPQDSYRIPTSGHTTSGALWGTGNVNSCAFRALSFCTIGSAIQRKKKQKTQLPQASGYQTPLPLSLPSPRAPLCRQRGGHLSGNVYGADLLHPAFKEGKWLTSV